MAKTLHFKVTEIELSEEEEAEEDAYLLAAMLETKDEKPVSEEETKEFEIWLKSSVQANKQTL